MSHDVYTWLIHARWLTYTHVTYSYVTWLVYMWHGAFIRDVAHFFVIGPCIAWDVACKHDSYMRGDSLIHIWLIHTWDDLFICDVTHLRVTWLIHVVHDHLLRDFYTFTCIGTMRNMRHGVLGPCVTWLMHMTHTCEVTRSYVRDVLIRGMNHLYVTRLICTWHDSLTWYQTVYCVRHDVYTFMIIRTLLYHEPWLLHMTHTCEVTHSYVRDLFIRDIFYLHVTWLIHV